MMLQAKTLADTLTGVRFLLGLYLLWLGMHEGPGALPTAALMLLVAWITDLLDGPLARRDVRRRHTWIGDHDLEADLAVALGTWLYLALAGFISFVFAAAYGVFGAAALWQFGSAPLAWGLQALPYGAMIWTALRHVPLYGFLLATWVGLLVVITWPRFPQHMLPEFLNAMRDLRRRS
jgi:cardiolipin synthase